MKIKVKYRDDNGELKEKTTECELEDKLKDIINNIAIENNIKINRKVVILNERKVNLKSEQTFDKFKTLFNSGKNESEMIFYDDLDKIAKFTIIKGGENKTININKEEDTLLDVFRRMKINFKKYFFLGGGDIIKEEEYNKKVDQLDNKLIENDDNNINIIMYENENNEEEDINKETHTISDDKKTKNNEMMNDISNNNNLNENILDVKYNEEEKLYINDEIK